MAKKIIGKHSGEVLLTEWRQANGATGIGYRPFWRDNYAGKMTYDQWWGRVYRAMRKEQREVHPRPQFKHSPRLVLRPHVELRAAVWDIESTALNSHGYREFMTVGCILPTDNEDILTYALTWDERPDDRRILREFLATLTQFDFIIGHNTHAHDLNWLHSRCMAYGMVWPRAWVSYDTLQVAKTLAAKTFKSLGTLCEFYSVPYEKTQIGPLLDDMYSDDPFIFEYALQETIDHCQKDVISNRNLFDAMYHYSLTLRDNPWKMTKWKVGVPALALAA